MKILFVALSSLLVLLVGYLVGAFWVDLMISFGERFHAHHIFFTYIFIWLIFFYLIDRYVRGNDKG